LQIYLHKILPILLLPAGLCLLLLFVGLILRRWSFVWIGVVLLWLSSTPIVGNFAIRSAESWAERSQPKDVPNADAIVVLSGGRVIAPGPAAVSEWTDANRFEGGIELFKAGKAPKLIFTGGYAPWESKAKPEGEVLAEYAKSAGIPTANIEVTGPVVNTQEEAQAVATILNKNRKAGDAHAKPPRILLVTSAFHMPRAQQLFVHASLEVIPFPVNFRVSAEKELSVLDFLPCASAMLNFEIAWREMYGRLYYGLRNLF